MKALLVGSDKLQKKVKTVSQRSALLTLARRLADFSI